MSDVSARGRTLHYFAFCVRLCSLRPKMTSQSTSSPIGRAYSAQEKKKEAIPVGSGRSILSYFHVAENQSSRPQESEAVLSPQQFSECKELHKEAAAKRAFTLLSAETCERKQILDRIFEMETTGNKDQICSPHFLQKLGSRPS